MLIFCMNFFSSIFNQNKQPKWNKNATQNKRTTTKMKNNNKIEAHKNTIHCWKVGVCFEHKNIFFIIQNCVSLYEKYDNV